MDEHARHHHTRAIAALITAVAALIVAVCFFVLVVWVVRAEQNAKLYLDDNMVCYSQPFAIECHPRVKP